MYFYFHFLICTSFPSLFIDFFLSNFRICDLTCVMLDSCPNGSKWFRLYGILHAILLLLAGRVASVQHPKSPLVGNEMMFLIFSRAPRYTELYDLLIDALEAEAGIDLPSSGKIAPTNSNSTTDKVDMDVDVEVDVEVEVEVPIEVKSKKTSAADNKVEKLWIATALLILDTMSQSLLVDKSVLKVIHLSVCLSV